MKRGELPDDVQQASREQVELWLAHIEGSRLFRRSARHRALLRYVVGHALDGDLAALKESVIAAEVFGRAADRYDPKLDTLVRVEARRLRTRLSAYYSGDGRGAPIRIELPVGGYVPLISRAETPPQARAATRRARDLIERGEHFLRQALSKETLESALERFEQALRESPDQPEAYVGIGRAWLNLATGWHLEPALASARAADALQRALVLAPDHAVAHVLLGAVRHQFEQDWPRAERSFRRAVELAPQQPFVHSAYGCHLAMRGRFEPAQHHLLLSRELDPHYLNTRIHMVNLRIAQGRLDDAQAELLAMQDIAPATVAILGLRGAIAMFRGDAAAAVAEFERLCASAPDYAGCFVSLASALAMAGRTAEADALFAQTLQRFAGRPLSPYVQAIFWTRRGNPDRAFALLERAVRERDPSAVQIPLEPHFAALRGDARWAAYAARRA